MNGILLLLPVFLPLVLGLLSYFLPIRSEGQRRLVYSVLILGTTALAWLAILLCDDGTFTLLHFSHISPNPDYRQFAKHPSRKNEYALTDFSELNSEQIIIRSLTTSTSLKNVVKEFCGRLCCCRQL